MACLTPDSLSLSLSLGMDWANLRFGSNNDTAPRNSVARRLLTASRRLLDDFEWEEQAREALDVSLPPKMPLALRLASNQILILI